MLVSLHLDFCTVSCSRSILQSHNIVKNMDAAVTTALHPTPSSLHPEQGIALSCTYFLQIKCCTAIY